MKKLLSENLPYAEYHYPYAEKINPLLFSFISSLKIDIPYNGGKKDIRNITRWIKNERLYVQNKEVEIISEWVFNILRRDFYCHPGIDLLELWGLIYKNGDSHHSHCHPPFLYTFCYYINSPKGASPLVFSTSKKKFKPESGKLLIFDARLFHEIPINKGEFRCVLSGNFL